MSVIAHRNGGRGGGGGLCLTANTIALTATAIILHTAIHYVGLLGAEWYIQERRRTLLELVFLKKSHMLSLLHGGTAGNQPQVKRTSEEKKEREREGLLLLYSSLPYILWYRQYKHYGNTQLCWHPPNVVHFCKMEN